MVQPNIPLDPFTQALQHIRGLIEAGQLQPAAVALNAAQKQAPTDARVPLIGMRLAQRAGKPEQAVQSARRALALAPGWHVAQIELALLLAQQKQGDEAMQLAMQALASAPQEPQVMAGAINVALFSDRGEQTLAWAEDGVRRFPDNAGIRLFLARYLAAQQRHSDAAAQYEYVHQRAPANEEALQGLLDCALALGDDGQARAWADRLLALKPDDPGAQYWHAVAYGRTRRSRRKSSPTSSTAMRRTSTCTWCAPCSTACPSA